MNAHELMRHARRARENAYAPYSQYAVGAALLAEDGRVFLGCNVENAAFTPTCCAERVALFRAVADGVRRFRAIAVTGGPTGEAPTVCTPCGVCRQTLREFVEPQNFTVYMENTDSGEQQVCTLADLLPLGFGAENLPEKKEKESHHDDL